MMTKGIRINVLLFYALSIWNVCSGQQQPNNLQPKIVTDDGHIKFQSAKNRNISFVLDGDSDVEFGEISIKAISSSLEAQSNEIKKLMQVGNETSCSSDICGKHGVCIGYRCICQGLYTGQHCEIFNPCVGIFCQNNGVCQNIGGRGVCVCAGNWFGLTCNVPKPDACSYEIKERIGIITSPGYPESYPNNMECTWDLETHPGSNMQLVVMATSIGLMSNCTSEFLQITDKSTSQILAKLCGQVPSQTHQSISNKVQIKFKSGAAPIGFGFSLFFSEESNNICGGRLTEPTSTLKAISSSSQQHCIWVVDVQSPEDIVLKFVSLSINNTVGGCQSYLEIRAGLSFDSPLIEKVCHHEDSQKIFHTKTSKLFIRFVSKTVGNKFNAIYFSECGGIINLHDRQKHEITSPFYPNPYPRKINCRWVFHADRSQIITLRFMDINIESHQLCGYDKLTVENGESMFTFCGNAYPLPISSAINRMVVSFDSDGDGDFKGFKAIVESSDKDCSRSWYHKNNGFLHSPLYPSYYDSDRECVYTISSDRPQYGITLSFQTFSLEDSNGCMNDYVEFFDGDSIKSPKLLKENGNNGRICGSTHPPPLIPSTGRALTIRFRSDQLKNMPGFSATWKSFLLASSEYRSEESGTIQSPSYPNQYGANINFHTHIESKYGHQIELSFNFFALEYSEKCVSDHMIIYDGPDTSSRVLGTFCGSDSPERVVSSGNHLLIVFKSDGSTGAGGYYGHYKTSTNLCGGVLYGQGILKSPGYPKIYPSNLECTWVIKAKVPYNVVKITITDLDMENSVDCSKDFLKIEDGRKRGGRLLSTVCGIISTRTTYRSSGRYLSLIFSSNEKINWKGFNIEYEEECYHILSARSGLITSPNYPLAYPENTKCTWVIKGHEQDKVILSSPFFDLSSNCSVASLTISGDENSNIFTYCNSIGPNSVSLIYMATLRFTTFKSSNMLRGRGFKLSYTIEGCYGEYNDPTGTITSPNYPSPYPSLSYCVWKVNIAKGKKIKLQFTDFDLETDCQKDFVSIFNGGDLQAPKIGTFCSRRKHISLESSSNFMTILFKSDLFINRKGFSATYQTIDGGCGGELIAERGNIYSPGYPSNYPRSSFCQWTINVNTTQRIQILIPPLDLPNSNNGCQTFVELLDGITFNRIEKFCQSTSTSKEVSTGGNKAIVIFSSHQNVFGNAFNISYSLACGGRVDVGDDDVIITSPHYPNYYERGVCQWLLTTSPGKSLFLTFDDFSIDSCPQCGCSVLTIQDGSSSTSPFIGSYCGENLPKYTVSSSNVLLVTLNISSSDSVALRTGFKAIVSSDPATCGGILTNIGGNIISPLYPNKSPSNADCIWKIKVSEGSRVTFQFESDFQSDCTSTYVNIYDASTISGTLLSKVCDANLKQTHFTSTSNEMTIQFFTTKQHPGFSASYRTDCLEIDINDVTGYIESPNYPRFYPVLSSCSWNFNVPDGKKITFIFEDFDLEPKLFGFCFDEFIIRNKDSHDEKVVLCGTSSSAIDLNWRRIKVSFTSDDSNGRHGFKVKYIVDLFIPNCGGNIVALEETNHITSPGFPKHYKSFLSCNWEITSFKKGWNVHVFFDVFKIEYEGSDCRYDYFEIIGSNSPDTRFCGNMANQKQFFGVKDGKMTLKFKSDFAIADIGFNISYKAVCGSEETATKGIIKSLVLNTTKQYESNQRCRWNIKHLQGGSIRLRFKSFDLEASVNCSKDYVLITNGVFETSSVVGKLCGNQLPKELRIDNHEVGIVFVSDNNTNGHGFEVEYERHIEGCGGVEFLTDHDVSINIQSPNFPQSLPKNTECEWELKVPIGKLIMFTFQTFNLTSDENSCSQTFLSFKSGTDVKIFCGYKLKQPIFITKTNILKLRLRTGLQTLQSGFSGSWKIGCGGVFFSAKGSIESSNFPKTYDTDSTCNYAISIPEEKKQVHLYFTEFDLEGSDNNCVDYVKVYDDSEKNNLVGKFCGKKAPFSLTAVSHELLIELKSDHSLSNNKGFSAQYTTFGEECGGSIVGSGTFSSPSHPRIYPTGRRCTWNVQINEHFSSADHGVELNIETMDIAESIDCGQDYLLVRNGWNKDSPVIGRYCGQVTNKLVWSSSKKMQVVFFSNRDNLRGHGFKASFKQGHKGCGGSFVGTSGYITTPGFGTSGRYPNRANCIWKISAADRTHVIQLKAVTLEIEDDIFCSYDKLVVRDGYTADSQELVSVCGNKTGQIIATTSGPHAYLQFISDGAAEERGFNVFWTTNATLCGGELKSTFGSIKSPDYPSSYFTNQHSDCVWIGKIEPSGGHIVLTIKDLNIPISTNCDDNKLIIQNGLHPDSPVITTLCGNISSIQHQTYGLNGTHFRIHLVSTNANVGVEAFRFKIDYKSLGSCGGVLYNDDGIISSPGYPHASISFKNCEWVIRTTPGEKILIHIDDLDLDGSCKLSYVKIFDGVSSSDPIIGTLCNAKIQNSVYESKSNVIMVQFQTGFFTFGRGFKLTYTTSCGGTLRGRQGYVQSPGYPGKYSKNVNCEWIIDVKPHYSVRMTKADIKLPPASNIGVCNKDVILIREGANSSGNLIGQFCGDIQLRNYQTTYHQVFLSFQSDGVDDGAEYYGGKVSYDTVCGEHIKNSLSGKITFKPEDGYDHLEHCEWLIEFPLGKRVSILTTSVNLEPSFPQCLYDKIEIRDGRNDSSPLIGKTCDFVKLPHLQSSTNFLFIKFTSDQNIAAVGFELEYSESTQLRCGGTVSVSTNMTFSSPMVKAVSYETCGWSFQVPSDKRVQIIFDRFNIPTDPRTGLCLSYVYIYEGPYPLEQLKRTSELCGETSPGLITSDSNRMYLLFNYEGAKSFNATIKAVDKVCGGKYNLNEGQNKKLTITGLVNGTSCGYLFTAPIGNQVTLKVTSLSLGDKNKTCKSKLVLKRSYLDVGAEYCGDVLPPTYHGSGDQVIMLLKNMQPQYSISLEYSSLQEFDFTFTTSNGLLTSPNYPLLYPSNSNSRLSIISNKGQVISLYPVVMELQQPYSGTCQDYVNIYDVDLLGSQYLIQNKSFCGNKLPPSVESSGNNLRITFKSNQNKEEKGFVFSYLLHPPSVCGGDITGQSVGAISTPNYPSFYKANLTCEWKITVINGKRISMSVEGFEMEHPTIFGDCTTVDYLELLDSDGASFGQFCGTAQPVTRETTSNTLTVKFKSNSKINDYKGFRMRFTEV